MGAERIERRLAAILNADVAGYSRLMAEDEAETVRVLEAYREVAGTLVRQHRGRVVDAPGDNLLAELPSALDAVEAAVEIQRVIAARNAAVPPKRRMEYRIGVHLGDVVAEGERIYGEGVNVAARLEGLAEPGGICVSDVVHRQVARKLPLEFEDLGERALKNIPGPVRVLRIRRDATPRTERAVLEPPEGPSIAVLPFTNMSGDPEQEYFADGITEDLLTGLSKISGLFVISRSSTFTYKGKAMNVRDVGRELGVRFVVEGSVRKAGPRVRITAQLVEAPSGHHLWAERYDRELSDLFAVQDEVTASIVSALEVKLTPAERERVGRDPTRNPEAYDRFLRGISYFQRSTREGIARARDMFESAIALDPRFALVHAWTARTYMNEWIRRYSDDPGIMERALELARKAISLDESEAIPHAILGLIHAFAGEHDEGLRETEKAIALDPSNPEAHEALAGVLNLSGRPEEAIRLLRRAERLDPRHADRYAFQLGLSCRLLGRYEEAIEHFNRHINDSPDALHARMNLLAIYGHLGAADKAKGELAEIRRIEPRVSLRNMARLAYKNPEDFRWLVDGARKAGLEE
jgi:adenylate cyclase